MHTFLVSIFAAAGFAAAASTAVSEDAMPDLSKVPQCALQCLMQAAGSSSCSLVDAYCQCTTGAADIVKVLLPCLCNSACSPDDLMGTVAASSEICSTALKAHGQDFKVPPASPDLCKAFKGDATPPTEEPPKGSPPTPPTEEPPKSSPPSDQPGPKSGATSPTSGYVPKTNLTAPSPSGHTINATNATNTTSGQAAGSSGVQQSTGGAAGLEVGMRMVGTAVLIGLIGAGVGAL